MKISVIMPSYLGDYPGAASDRERKFLRAVDSFLDQGHDEKLLIINSDGCEITTSIFDNSYSICENVFLIDSLKQPLFSGMPRMESVSLARHLMKSDVICYLDTDDVFLPDHLSNIARAFDENPGNEWIYFNDTLMHTREVRQTSLQYARIGTSNIAHRAHLPIAWGDGYGHDWKAIESLMPYRHDKFNFATYGVCHCPNEPLKFDV
jgi:glycosyltransferase involved in cell wall biosynthesis